MSQSEFRAEVRWLRSREAEQVYALERRCYREPWSLELIRQSLESLMTYGRGLFLGGKLEAYAIFQLVFAEAHLLNIAVSPERRRQGLARELMQDFHAEILRQDARIVFLEVRPSNAPARQLYELFSYRQIGERAAYYADGERALVLAKALKDK